MDTESGAARNVSVTQPIGYAFERTGTILFQPFDIKKWFVLGFAAFLGHLGESGGGGNPFGMWEGGGGGGSPSSSGSSGVEEFEQWVLNNLGLIITIGALILIVLIGISLLIVWLNARGRFIFIDGVVRNRGAIVEPWKEYRVEGNSVFLFNVVLLLIFLPVIFATIIAAGLAIWPDIKQDQISSGSLMAIVIGGGIILLASLVFGIIGALLRNFVMPTMYLGRVRVREGWSIAWQELIQPHVGKVILYLIMRIVLGIAVGIIATVAMCLTCCIVMIPYIGTVILLPLYVFMQAYALHFIEQFGPDWKVFVYDPPLSPPMMATGPGVPPYEPTEGPLGDGPSPDDEPDAGEAPR